jgi:hypothetical protein
MRCRLSLATVVTAAVIGACVREERVAPSAAHPAPALEPPSPVAAPPPQYLIAEAQARGAAQIVVPLGKEGSGVVQEGARFVVTGAGARAAKDATEGPIVGVDPVPRWLGAGFVFRTATALYATDAFDGPLRPLVTMREAIAHVGFGPKSALVRMTNGERVAVAIPSGARAPLAPAGVADVAAAGDGRAAALTDAGGALVTVDSGEHWTDVTSQLSARPERVVAIDDAPWIVDAGGHAVRVDAGGRLAPFAKLPAIPPTELRPKDPRWHGDEMPLRRAMRLGAPDGESSALVAGDGDIARVSLRTGEVLAVTEGRLPLGSTCEAVRAEDDLLFACVRQGGAFVVSHATGDKAPIVEQTFATVGAFYASDDGALAFGGPCARAKASRQVACVRAAAGGWHEYDLDATTADGGAAYEVTRWIPRADGGAVAFVGGAAPGMIDARTHESRPWALDAMPPAVKAALTESRARATRDAAHVVDRAWSLTPAGVLRGWMEGAAIELSADGSAAVSPFTFDRVATAGALALARSRDGRVWQTLDRGITWGEIAPPPTARSGGGADLRACSAAGCDLGAWYRVGWVMSPPAPTLPPLAVSPPPRFARPPLAPLACSVIGEGRVTATARSDRSPDDLDLGAARIAPGSDDFEMARLVYGRVAPNPPHGESGSSDGDFGAPRVVVHGFGTEFNGDDPMVVHGPVRDPLALRRHVAFVVPFDPAAGVKRASFGVGDLVASARAIGVTPRDLVREDVTVISGVALVTPSDPGGASDIALLGGGGLVGVVRSLPQPRVRVALRLRTSDEPVPVSAVAIGVDDVAILEVSAEGAGHVIKLGPSGVRDLFDVPPPARAQLYPANADALALGPRGELGILRTPSGSEPPTAADPAIVITSGGTIVPLAPWSTLVGADDPSCRADANGWRATVQPIAPWVRLAGLDPKIDDDAPMFARVRWSDARVCLEAIEARLPDASMRVPARPGAGRGALDDRRAPMLPVDAAVETWLVARFLPAPVAAKVSIAPGIEARQPMQCTIAAP